MFAPVVIMISFGKYSALLKCKIMSLWAGTCGIVYRLSSSLALQGKSSCSKTQTLMPSTGDSPTRFKVFFDMATVASTEASCFLAILVVWSVSFCTMSTTGWLVVDVV